MWFPESPVAHPQALRGLPPPAQWEAFFLRSERERDGPCVPGRFLVGPRGGRVRGVGPGWSPVSGTLPGSRSLTTTGQSQHWGQLCPGGCAPEPSQWPEGPTPAPGSGTSCLRVAVCPTRGPDVTPSPPLLLQAPSTSRCPHVPGWSRPPRSFSFGFILSPGASATPRPTATALGGWVLLPVTPPPAGRGRCRRFRRGPRTGLASSGRSAESQEWSGTAMIGRVTQPTG